LRAGFSQARLVEMGRVEGIVVPAFKIHRFVLCGSHWKIVLESVPISVHPWLNPSSIAWIRLRNTKKSG